MGSAPRRSNPFVTSANESPARVQSLPLAPGLKVHVPPVPREKPAAAGPVLDRRELKRRIWHIAPGFLPFILWFIPHRDPFSWRVRGGALAFILILGVQIFRQFSKIKRSETDERGKLGAVLGYALSILAMVLFFPAHGELAFTVLAVLAFGDGFATLGGLALRGPRLPWNRAKTWSGFACFIAAATLMGSIIYWGEANPRIPFAICVQLCAFTALAAAVSESLPSRINDNIRVGIAAPLAVIAAQALWVGF